MRFRDLPGLTRLPVEHVRHRFRNEEVIAVLPGRGGTAGWDSLLVATPSKLAIVTSEAPSSGYWMTYWAPWDVVMIDGDEATDDEIYGLSLRIGRLAFHARLSGQEGQRALRDFVVAVQTRKSASARA